MSDKNLMHRLKTYSGLAFFFLLFWAGQFPKEPVFDPSAEMPGEREWVDSVYKSMNEQERLGQLFMIRAHSDKGPDHIALVEKQIKKYHVGGLCFFQGTPEKQIELINKYQSISKLPLMIAMDAEWGLGMRMKATTISFPRQLTLGAIQDEQLIYKMGKEIARELLRVGVQVNFAPVADINNNPDNPVIHTRSFGEDRLNVVSKSYQYMKGMQDNGVMACAKHFPGHGDTDVDSHLDLPVIKHSWERLDSIELYPFKALFDRHIGSVMIAHLQVPALDDRPDRPTTLSNATVSRLLRDALHYDGIAFTDALEMKGVTKHFADGEVEAEALVAGNDVLTLPGDMDKAFAEINRYLKDGRLTWDEIETHVKRILHAKYRLGLTKFKSIPTAGVLKDLNQPAALAIKQELFENAMTLVRNQDQLIPFRSLDTLSLASLSIGADEQTPFQRRLSSYVKMPHFQTGKRISSAEETAMIGKLASYDAVIISLHNMSASSAGDFGISEDSRRLIKNLSARTKVVVVSFGTPYALKFFDENAWILQAYEEDPLAQDVAAQALFGAFSIQGRLPVTASPLSRFNTGIMTREIGRLGYALPEQVGLSSDALSMMESLMKTTVDSGAAPGGVVLLAKDGKIVYKKAFGFHTYEKKVPTETDDIFDLASITKIAATTISVMRLADKGLFNMEDTLGKYLPELKNSNKAGLVIKDVMAHRAGLRDWIPFFEQTTVGPPDDPKPSDVYYRPKPEGNFTLPVTEKLFLRKDFADSIWQQIIDSEVSANKQYKYSDLGFYMLGRIVGRQSGQPIESFVQSDFYKPLGLQTATYRPWEKFDINKIVPTEEEAYWRRQRIQGYVHDMGAAMLNGVSGHAGLFADAQDLAIIMQMLLQRGYYGGEQYIHPETIAAFATRYPGETRRGIGFDMLQQDKKHAPNFSPSASEWAFGHQGFTGTVTCVDPAYNMVFVFLTNRTYPSMKNTKMNKMDIRVKMQDIAYKALMKEESVR